MLIQVFKFLKPRFWKPYASFLRAHQAALTGIWPQHLIDLINSNECGRLLLLTSLTSFEKIMLQGKLRFYRHSILIRRQPHSFNKEIWRNSCLWLLASYEAGSCYMCQCIRICQTIKILLANSAWCRYKRRLWSNGTCLSPPLRQFTRRSRDRKTGRRDTMLKAVYTSVPEIYSFCHLSCSNAYDFKFADHHINSEEGVQQGDSLGQLLFCLTIHPFIQSLSSNSIACYVDEITIGDPAEVVAEDVKSIVASGTNREIRPAAYCTIIQIHAHFFQRCYPLRRSHVLCCCCCYYCSKSCPLQSE